MCSTSTTRDSELSLARGTVYFQLFYLGLRFQIAGLVTYVYVLSSAFMSGSFCKGKLLPWRSSRLRAGAGFIRIPGCRSGSFPAALGRRPLLQLHCGRVFLIQQQTCLMVYDWKHEAEYRWLWEQICARERILRGGGVTFGYFVPDSLIDFAWFYSYLLTLCLSCGKCWPSGDEPGGENYNQGRAPTPPQPWIPSLRLAMAVPVL